MSEQPFGPYWNQPIDIDPSFSYSYYIHSKARKSVSSGTINPESFIHQNYQAAINQNINILQEIALNNSADKMEPILYDILLFSIEMNLTVVLKWCLQQNLIRIERFHYFPFRYAVALFNVKCRMESLQIIVNHCDNVLGGHSWINCLDNQCIRQATLNEYLPRVQWLLENGADIHSLNDEALRNAAIRGDISMLQTLLQYKEKRPMMEEMLVESIGSSASLEMTIFLVENGADLFFNDCQSLVVACEIGAIEIVKFLLKMGANVNANEGQALFRALRYDHSLIAKLLIVNGANVNGNPSPLLSVHGDCELAKLLVENGADIHVLQEKCLRMACKYGHQELAFYLLDQGADFHVRNEGALRMAAENGQINLVKELCKRGADISADNHYALRLASENGHLEVCKILVAHGANIHSADDSSLQHSAYYGHFDVVLFLLEKGADIHADDDVALRSCVKTGNLLMTKILVSNGADVHAEEEDAIQNASKYGHLEIVSFLFEQGANIHSKNELALRLALKYNRQNVAKYLIEKGADKKAFFTSSDVARQFFKSRN